MRAFVTTIPRSALAWLVLMWCALAPSTLSAVEVTRFKLTGYSAFLETLTRYDENRTQRAGGEATRETSPKSQRRLGGTTQGYIYHPNLVRMNLSGSLLFDQRSFKQDNGVETDDSGIAWDIGTNFDFLSNKPYPFSLFLHRTHPLIFTGESDSFSQENTRFGLKFSLLQPFSPVNVKTEITRDMREGEGPNVIEDNTTDQFSTSLDYPILWSQHSQLGYDLIRSNDRSGNPNLAIREVSNLNHRVNLINRWVIGDRQQYVVNNQATYNLVDKPNRQHFRLSPNFTWHHNDRMRSVYDYNFNMTTRDDDSAYSNDARARLHLTLSDRLFGSAGVHTTFAEAGSSQSQTYGADTRAVYTQPTPIGDLTLNGAVGVDFNNQEATTSQTTVVDEAHELSSIRFDPLNNDFVIAGSVVITNTTRTQTFREGIDYTLRLTGAQTEVIMIIGGAIDLSGDDNVLINYNFETGGSFSFYTLSSNLGANMTVARYYQLFARITDRRQMEHSRSLILERRLNSSTVTEFGTRANVPIWFQIRVGGDARYRHLEQEFSPSDTISANAWLGIPLPFLRSSLDLSAARSMTEVTDSLNDSDLTKYTARINSNPWHRITLTADTSYEEDTGSPLLISRSEANFRATWQVRKLRLSAVAQYLQTTQGDLERDRLEAWLLIRRDIW